MSLVRRLVDRLLGRTTATITGQWSGWTPDCTTGIAYYRTTVVTPWDKPLLVLATVRVYDHPRDVCPECCNVIVSAYDHDPLCFWAEFWRKTVPQHDHEVMRLADDGCPHIN